MLRPAVLALAVMVTAQSLFAAEPESRAIVPNRAPLAATPFVRLPIGSVRAEGWLLRQLELQRDGLTGSAEQIYDALTPDSAWLGGKGEGWEKGPYYVKGLIALAYTLDDATLKERAQKWVDWALKSQRADGFFGPESNDDWWPRMVVIYYLRDYYEATNDARVLPFLTNYFHHQLEALPGRPLKDWGKSRAGDNMDVVLWLYNRTGDSKLLDLAKLLNEQAYPWTSIFTEGRFYGFRGDFQPHHIVNVSQALKFPAVAWQVTKSDADKNGVAAGVANLEKKYGRIDGQVSGTEMLSGKKSTDGVELCADIERIISNGVAVTALGDPALGDQMEKVAFNSLPAHTSPTMRQITYYQLINQVAATHGGHGFQQDYGNGNVPGPHSGFPCCCYNWHAGWPKYVEQMWAATTDGGVVAIAYGPNQLSTTVGDVPLKITQTTDYPFAETITLKVDPQKAATFPLVLRVPAWCESPTVTVNGEAVDGIEPGSFHRIAREWKPGDTVALTFPMKVKRSTWTNNSAGLERGPLAFGLKIGEQWSKTNDLLQDFDEFEVRPTTPWNYALDLASDASNVKVSTKPVGAIPFATDAAPVTLTVPAKRVPTWVMRTLPGKIAFGKSDGKWQQLADTNAMLEPGVPHKVRVEAKGTLISVSVDGVPQIQHEDATFASGSIGLRTYQSAAKFDDVTLDGRVVADFQNGAKDWKPLGGKWNVADGAYGVDPARDGKAVLAGKDGLKDFVYEATVTIQPGGDAGLMFRVNDVTPALDGYHGYYVGLTVRKGASEDAQEPPQSPVQSSEPTETVELIPFGSSKLRVSYFPTLAK